MTKGFQNFLWAMLIFGCIISCAKRGSPTGGPKDLTPPTFVDADPQIYAIDFNTDEIRIYFDEYIQLLDPQRQIIISPPMETKALISPMGTARKYVEIEFRDTLLENTTYTISFGQSIVDFNEENPLPFFKYVFSTGNYIDSLRISGTVESAFQKTPDDFISVMLYEIDSTYSDSIVYNEAPTYISYSRDSTHTFQIENIKEGTYQLIALKDVNSNYTFEPGQDKIAFLDSSIHIPTDSVFHLRLFQEILDFEAKRPKHAAQQHLIFGYQGIPDSISIKLLSEKPADFDYRIVKDPEKDTLHYFYKPIIEKDSLVFELSNEKYRDTLVVFLRELEKDSLKFDAFPTQTIGFEEAFELRANNPIVSKDTSLISILDKDSLNVGFSSTIDFYENELRLKFEKEEAQSYQITFLPGAVTGFFGEVNDSLNYRVRTKELSDYGILAMNLQNIQKFPIIVQLLTTKGAVVKELYSKSETLFNFKNIEPGSYFVRIIFDENENRKWDTGDYLKSRQPERTAYFPDTLEIRANWDVMQTFILK